MFGKKPYEQLNEKADGLYENEKFGEAIRLYTESIEMAKKAGKDRKAKRYTKELQDSIDALAEKMNEEGDQLFKEEKYKKSMDAYEKAWSLIQKAGSGLFKDIKRRSYRKEYYKAKEKYCEEVLRPRIQGLIDNEKWEEAESIYKEMIEKISANVDSSKNQDYKEEMNDFYEDWADFINEKGDKALKNDDFESAVDYYTQARKLINKTDDHRKIKKFKKELAKAYKNRSKEINHKGDELMKQEDYKEAVNLYETSFDLAQEAENDFLMGRYEKELEKAYKKRGKEINKKADKLLDQEKYEDAIKLYAESVQMVKNANSTLFTKLYEREYKKSLKEWGKKLNERGDTAMANENWKKAAQIYQTAYNVIKKSEDQDLIQDFYQEYIDAIANLSDELNKIGEELFDEEKYEKAFEIFDEALKLAEEAKIQDKIQESKENRQKTMKKMEKL